MELAQYIRLFRRWFWLLIVAAFVGGGVSFIVRANQPPEYRLPWQKPLKILTPGRILQGFQSPFPQIGAPSHEVKMRGKSPGCQTGRRRSPPPRFKTVKRDKKLPQNS